MKLARDTWLAIVLLGAVLGGLLLLGAATRRRKAR